MGVEQPPEILEQIWSNWAADDGGKDMQTMPGTLVYKAGYWG